MQYAKHSATTAYLAAPPNAGAPAIKRHAAQPIAQDRYIPLFRPIFSTSSPLGICSRRAMKPVAPAMSMFSDSLPPSNAT